MENILTTKDAIRGSRILPQSFEAWPTKIFKVATKTDKTPIKLDKEKKNILFIAGAASFIVNAYLEKFTELTEEKAARRKFFKNKYVIFITLFKAFITAFTL